MASIRLGSSPTSRPLRPPPVPIPTCRKHTGRHKIADVKRGVAQAEHDIVDVKRGVAEAEHDVADVKREVAETEHGGADVKREVAESGA